MPNEDPRVTRTKTALADALFDLIQRRRWEKIRVQDLLDETGISRSAFYAHYANKYELLVASVPDITLTIADTPDVGPNLVPLFEHVDEMALILRPLMAQPVLSDIADTMHRAIVNAWTEYLVQAGYDANDWVMVEMLSGALEAVLKAYIFDRDRLPAATVAAKCGTHVARLLPAR